VTTVVSEAKPTIRDDKDDLDGHGGDDDANNHADDVVIPTEFEEVQQFLPSCVLRTFGFMSRSEAKLTKRLAKLQAANSPTGTPKKSHSCEWTRLLIPPVCVFRKKTPDATSLCR
jgi:hypothetical protein